MPIKPVTAAALRVLEDFGLPPVPCGDDKKPIEKNWTRNAHTDMESVERAFESTSATLVGVLTGRISGQFVVDVDPDGAQWFAEHLADLAPGFMYTSRRANGRHLWYRVPDGWEVTNTASKIAIGIDTRGSGGQAIWWPEHGGTVLNDDGPRLPPAWLLEELERAGAAHKIGENKKPNGQSYAGPSVGGKQFEGGRNDMLTRRAGSMRRAGFSVAAIRDALHKENYERCEPTLPALEIEAIVDQASKWEEGSGPQSEDAPKIVRAPLEWLSLSEREPPARQWIINHWLPAGHTTLMAGRGGIGKSLLAQHLATAIVLGCNYIEPIAPQRVLMWACEDDHDELWRRQLAISRLMGSGIEALEGKLSLHSYAGHDVTLMAPVFGALETRPMINELREQVGDYKADIVILDNIARLYGGNENDRHSVTTFCAMIQGACKPAAVLLLGHPAKAIGSEFSGSTAWEGAVRARLYLSDRMPDQEEDGDTVVNEKLRYLSRRKANYSALDVRTLTLSDGVLIPDVVAPSGRAQAGVSGEYAKDVVRDAVRKLAARGIYGSRSTASPNYLPKLAKQYGLLDRSTDKQFGAVMRAMIMDGEIANDVVGSYDNRTPKSGLVIKDLHK